MTPLLWNQETSHSCLIHRWQDKASTLYSWDSHSLRVCPGVVNAEKKCLEFIWERGERKNRKACAFIPGKVSPPHLPDCVVCPRVSLHGRFVSLDLASLSITENRSGHKESRPFCLRMSIGGKTALHRKVVGSRSSPEGGVPLLPVAVPYSGDSASCTLGSYRQRWPTLRKKGSTWAALGPFLRATVEQFAKFGKEPSRARSEDCKWKG